ncbi:uncharacterized protein F4807DRAFT_439730 [Annulohypoxylon truncatum]|uniref:uncharacterized protein n=1 Tax=Annulohypoxylon truncatum TaxID=327061 RepID=UPI0020088AE2|nr:uncharacterized protein F4807DRAFT_439730 [Annulohypoxylon truncatum]KAI1206335.1 hypothetical protein F4807DRAFT_439730 [Annulohypoxylon truncatum]
MASKDGSKESDAKESNEDKKDTGNAPGKKPWWDMSAEKDELLKICAESQCYGIDVNVSSIAISQHMRNQIFMSKKLDFHEARIKATRDRTLELCGRKLKDLEKSIDKLRALRLKVERVASTNEKARQKAADGAKSQPSYPSMSVGPDDLTRLGLHDLRDLLRDLAVDRALEDNEVRWRCQTNLLRRLPLPKEKPEARPMGSSALAPVRKWMNPKQQRRQLRKRYIAVNRNYKPRPAFIERTSPRIQLKKKMLNMLKSTRQHRRLRLKAMVVGQRFVDRVRKEEHAFFFSTLYEDESRILVKFLCKRHFGEVPEHLQDDFDIALKKFSSYKINSKWPWED